MSIILQIDHSVPLPRSLKERSSQMSTATSSSKRSGKLMLWQGPQRAVHTIRRPSSPWTTGDATCWVSSHLSSLLVTVVFGNSLKPSFHPRHVAALPGSRRSSLPNRRLPPHGEQERASLFLLPEGAQGRRSARLLLGGIFGVSGAGEAGKIRGAQRRGGGFPSKRAGSP